MTQAEKTMAFQKAFLTSLVYLLVPLKAPSIDLGHRMVEMTEAVMWTGYRYERSLASSTHLASRMDAKTVALTNLACQMAGEMAHRIHLAVQMVS
jgi:hypothetical protein